MAIVSIIRGADKVVQTLAQREKGQPRKVSVVVGYRSNYALHVHENREMRLRGQKRSKPRKGFYWDPQGKAQAGFLETPFRRHQGRIGEIIWKTVENGGSLEQGLVMAGLFLQRESQMMVPVDTGKLKASAFTEVEKVQ
jgi:hypothetical protein